MLYVFEPGFVAAHLPSSELAATISSQRSEAAANVLKRTCGDIGFDLDSALAAANEILHVFEGACFAGRPIASSYLSEAQDSNDWLRIWLTATVAREYRWEGHIAALLGAQLDAVEAMLLALLWRDLPRDLVVADRGWERNDVEEGTNRLSRRGLIRDGQLTLAGRKLRNEIEDQTNRLALPSTVSDIPRFMSVAASLSGLARACAETIPWDNPIGIDGCAESLAGRGVRVASGVGNAER